MNLKAKQNPSFFKTVPVDRIRVMNPRSRDEAKFQIIQDNICHLGLKVPVAVCPENKAGYFDLIHGQGRLEAFKNEGAKRILVIVMDVTREDALIMGLTENIARRHRPNIEQIRELHEMHKRGDTVQAIAKKTDYTPGYVGMMIKLIRKGEERLISAVEQGKMPLNIAIEIASSKSESMQRVLEKIQKKGKLTIQSLRRIKQIIDARETKGKALFKRKRAKRSLSADELVARYKQDSLEKELLIKKARLYENRIVLVAHNMEVLLRDPGFVDLLNKEGLDTMPRFLADKIKGAV